MRNEIFNSMKVNKQEFIKKIKGGKNPNRLRNEVDEELNEPEKIVETVEIPLLDINRVVEAAEMPLQPVEQDYSEQNEEEIVMENLSAARRTDFLSRFRTTFLNRENFLKKLNEWFELPLAVEGVR